jgi:hypothetical protein
VICLLDTIFVDDLHIAPNRDIVINDCPLDDRVLACIMQASGYVNPIVLIQCNRNRCFS